MPRALIIYNPVAGSGIGKAVAEQARQALEAKGWSVREEATRDRSGAASIARDLAGDADRVVIAGGDGTLRETIEGLGDRTEEIEIGFLPIGNANVVARELGIPLDATRAVRLLTEGEAAAVDLGHFRSSTISGLFIAMVGIGLDAVTVSHVDRLRHTRLGGLWYRVWADSAYVLCGLLAMLSIRQPRFRIRVDGELVGARLCAAYLCNFRTYAKGMAMAPDADPRSGRLHYQGRFRANPVDVVWHLIAAFRQRWAPDFISRYGDGQRIAVESEAPLPVQVDGDFRGYLSALEVEIRPAAARIIAPSVVDRPSRSVAQGPGASA